MGFIMKSSNKLFLLTVITGSLIAPSLTFAQDIPPMPIYASKDNIVKKDNVKKNNVEKKKSIKIFTKKPVIKPQKEADISSSFGNPSAENLAK